ncbi:hypothetical protein GE09DRAFT_1062427 [Coniochaeta sp. 2T2.1]|nr:hypothetical protein GE09DRAFT_1062427 [Coniochaeta sp. 2T2.1]
MSSNRRQTVYPALQQELGYQTASGTLFSGSADMSRTDSGYHSNESNRLGYYGDPNSILKEEADEFLYDDSAATMNWQYQYNMAEGVEATYDQQQFSSYIVEGAGSQMNYYQDDSTPRTANPIMVDNAYEASQDVDLDSLCDPLYKQEQQWPTHLDTLPHYVHDTYHDQAAGPSITSPIDDGSSTAYFDVQSPSLIQSPSIASSATPTTHHHAPLATTTNPPPTPATTTNFPPPRPNTTQTTTSSSSSTNRFPCLVGQCNKQFNRAADLDRHMKFIHCKATVPPMICDYRRCPRHKNPFLRADHFRDHLRDQHKEDLLKRGEAAPVPDATWWRERSPLAVYRGWWRCSKCFAKVVVEKEGWQCEGCGNWCEGERQGVRGLPRGCGYAGCEMGEEGKGREGKWMDVKGLREHLRVVHGEDVPVKEGKEGEKELQDAGWWEGRNGEVVYSRDWRCTRCLDLVDGVRDGFTCSGCGFGCEEVRRGVHQGCA